MTTISQVTELQDTARIRAHVTQSLDALHHVAFYCMSFSHFGSSKGETQGLLLSLSLKSSRRETANMDVFY